MSRTEAGMGFLRAAGVTAGLLVGLATGAWCGEVVEYHHVDAIGNVRAVTNGAGQVVERHDYLPFGEECTTGTCASNPGLNGGQPRKFTGKERDAETGLDYFGARYYGSKIGRFTTTDPAYTIQENLVDPQRWNRYAYARNNPLRYVDPDGRAVRLASSVKGSDASFVRNALIDYVRRPGGREQFGKLSGDERTITLAVGSLNDTNALARAQREHKSIQIRFAETDPDGKNATVTIDRSVHNATWTDPAGIDSGGLVTIGHEFKHVDDFLSGDIQRYISGDLPSSATGPAMQRGKAIRQEKPDLGKKEAAAIVDRELKQ
jgi:RHS repeat-associated protein